MSVAVRLQVDAQELIDAMGAIAATYDPARLIGLFGEAVQGAVQDNLNALDESSPNKMGGERTHWYAQAADSTVLEIEGDTAVISVTQIGAALRYYGGVVEAGANASSYSGQPTRFLTIPASPESYGKRAADMGPLKVLWGRNGPYALARDFGGRNEQSRAERAAAGYNGPGRGFGAGDTEILYWLKESVVIPADSRLLPTSDAMYDAIGAAWSDELDSILGGKN